jgi:hypothetical protein
MGSILEGSFLATAESQPRFVDQGRGLEGVPERFAVHLLGRDFSQFVIDEEEQFRSCLGIALMGAVEYAGHVTHENEAGG